MLCPICKKSVPDQPNAFAPFCSERCKLIDLGRWLGGKYQIPVDDAETPCHSDKFQPEKPDE
jgi:hypothetical protein